jgi:glutamate decarboxylase
LVSSLKIQTYGMKDYTLPPDGQNIEILRVVVRESMSLDLMDLLLGDLLSTTEQLMSTDLNELEAYSSPQSQRIEKFVSSLGVHGKKKGPKKEDGGILKTTC